MKTYDILEIVRVLDGDTLEVVIDLGFNIQLKQKVRLVNIDTPEIRTSNEEVKKYGIRAMEKLQEYLDTSNKYVITLIDSKLTGKYGRIIGDIYAVGNNLTASEFLAANNYAWIYKSDKHHDLSELAPLENEGTQFISI